MLGLQQSFLWVFAMAFPSKMEPKNIPKKRCWRNSQENRKKKTDFAAAPMNGTPRFPVEPTWHLRVRIQGDPGP